MFGIAENVTGVIQNSIKQWKTELTIIGWSVYQKKNLSGGEPFSITVCIGTDPTNTGVEESKSRI